MRRRSPLSGISVRYPVFIAFFLSGASGLILQVIWLRMLKLLFGSTVLATSTVLSAFMAGLALGSWTFGRLADRQTDRLRLYALLELGVGISALLLPHLFAAVTPLYTSLYRWQIETGSAHLGTLGCFALCFVLLLIPTTLMGGTLPVLCAHLIETRSTLGKRVGMLYALNTLGAMVGCAAAGFALIWLFGESGTLRLASGLYMLIGVVFLGYAARVARTAEEAVEDGEGEGTPEEPHTSARLVRLVLFAFGLSGMAALGYEVAWTRMLVYFVGLDTYAFSAMLTVFLMGVGLGSYLYTRFWDADTGLVRRLALLEFGIGLGAAGSLLLFSQMRHLNDLALAWDAVRTTWPGLVALKFLDALVAFSIPTLLMGAAFPLASKIVTSLRHKGRSIGHIYSINTLGSIVGSFVAGFALIPLLGVQETVILLAAVNLLIGAVLWAVASGRFHFASLGPGILAALVWLGLAGIAARTPMIEWTAGFHDEESGYELLYTRDGAAATVSVLEREDGIRELNLDGKSTAFTNYSDIQVHQFLGHLPLLLQRSPRPARVLVIGFGLGSTSWSCLQHDVERVDCVELVEEEQETARFFVDYNHDVMDHPKFNWIAGDGRNYLLATDREYDVISINAIHPRFSPSLYTSDFYELARARLAEDGLVCAWITLHGLTFQDYKMLLGSLLEVFPESTLWDVNSQHMVLIAGEKPLRIDYGLWRERLADERIRAHLEEVHLEHPHALLSHFMLDARAMRDFCAGAPLNSDDRPHVEFGHGIAATSKAEIFNALMGRRSSILPLLTDLPANEEARQRLYDDVARYHYAMQQALPGRFFLSVTHDRQRARPLLERALLLWPENRAFAHMLGRSELIAESERTPDFQKHWARGWLYEREGRWPEALEAYRRAVAADPRFVEGYRSLAFASARAGERGEAMRALVQLRALEDRSEYAQWYLALLVQRELGASDADTVSVRFGDREMAFERRDLQTDLFLARAYNEVGLPDLAEGVLAEALERHGREPRLYEAMGVNFLALGRFRDAESSFEQALALDPERRQAAAQLDLLRANVGWQIHPEKRIDPKGL